jgi:hypothetical protein
LDPIRQFDFRKLPEMAHRAAGQITPLLGSADVKTSWGHAVAESQRQRLQCHTAMVYRKARIEPSACTAKSRRYSTLESS